MVPACKMLLVKFHRIIERLLSHEYLHTGTRQIENPNNTAHDRS